MRSTGDLQADRLALRPAAQADLDGFSDVVAERIDFVIGRPVDRQDLVADEHAGPRGGRAVIDVADEELARIRLNHHADAGIADLAARRKQPAHVVADGEAEDVGHLEIGDRIRPRNVRCARRRRLASTRSIAASTRSRGWICRAAPRVLDFAANGFGETVERAGVVEPLVARDGPPGRTRHGRIAADRRPRPFPRRPRRAAPLRKAWRWRREFSSAHLPGKARRDRGPGSTLLRERRLIPPELRGVSPAFGAPAESRRPRPDAMAKAAACAYIGAWSPGSIRTRSTSST